MAKKSKSEKQAPNIVVFLVEGESDKIALEYSLSELIYEKYPEYHVRFLLQQKLVDKSGDEVDDNEADSEESDYEDEAFDEIEYKPGGDITTSSFVTPDNIVRKIDHRFINPATKAEGLYPKRIAKIIHIVDTDGAFIPKENVISFASERASLEKPYYDGDRGVIEAQDIDAIIGRNERKQKNLDFLLSLTEQGIKIGSKTIPYEIYFFSSNLDHFINHNSNLGSGKRHYAQRFYREYGLDIDLFCHFFCDDPAAIGHLGYYESWDEIRKDTNSVKRFTNIDCLIRKLQSDT